MSYSHPHPDPCHVCRMYRLYIVGFRRKFGPPRGLIHYRALLTEYLAAKRECRRRR